MDSTKRHLQSTVNLVTSFSTIRINDVSHLNSKLNVQQNVLKWFQPQSELINL